MKTNKKTLIIIVISVLILSELSLRLYGFGNPPIYKTNKAYGYFFANNQKVKRFGNLIQTNEYGMRSEEITPSDNIRILMIGDSVLNGGVQVSQENLATSMLAKKLTTDLHKKVNILNVSVGGWSIENAYGYIKKNDVFNASVIMLIFSSHDASQTFSNIDNDVNFPQNKPKTAIGEVVAKYIIPKVFIKKDTKIPHNVFLNIAWTRFIELAKKKNIPIYVVLHPTIEEINTGKYNKDGEKILTFLNKNKIRYKLELAHTKKEYYRDNIHYNSLGQTYLYHNLQEFFSSGNCNLGNK